jgi:23S rRNA-/tRNA-specific pseudouridylate synthase
LTVVEGILKDERGLIDRPVGRSERDRKKRLSLRTAGKRAQSGQGWKRARRDAAGRASC